MARALRPDLRNVAIVAHVDHGKTTLVDAMLRQTGSFGEHAHVEERAMDSNDLEREKGITILAKNTAITYNGAHATDAPVTINVIDTPATPTSAARSSAACRWSTASCCWWTRARTAAADPLRAAQGARGEASRHPARQQDRPPRRPHRRGGGGEPRPAARTRLRPRTTTCPTSTSTPSWTCRWCTPAAEPARHPATSPPTASCPTTTTWSRCSRRSSSTCRAPAYDDEAPLQAWVTNLDASAVPRPPRAAARLHRHAQEGADGRLGAARRHDRERAHHRAAEDPRARALPPPSPPAAGDIVAVAGIEDITIGETIADPDDVRPLPAIHVDDPAISMTIGTNTSPLVGKVKGHKLTARMVKDRLDRELDRQRRRSRSSTSAAPTPWEVQGRGELALAILVENMRREGFELTVGKPQVVTKKVDGKTYEPFEHLTIDAPRSTSAPSPSCWPRARAAWTR